MATPGKNWAEGVWAPGVWQNGVWEDDGPTPPPPGVTYIAGTAVSASGVMQTIFLNDNQAVPSNAVRLNGFAHAPSGQRYVAAWPSDDVVSYIRGIARRPDGAMCIVSNGTIAAYSAGMALTERGEVLVSTAAPQLTLAGLGLRQTGHLCVSEAS